VPQWNPDGQLVLREEWQRFGEHATSGISYLEEVVPEESAHQSPAAPLGTSS
jgi:hypothetical protein